MNNGTVSARKTLLRVSKFLGSRRVDWNNEDHLNQLSDLAIEFSLSQDLIDSNPSNLVVYSEQGAEKIYFIDKDIHYRTENVLGEALVANFISSLPHAPIQLWQLSKNDDEKSTLSRLIHRSCLRQARSFLRRLKAKDTTRLNLRQSFSDALLNSKPRNHVDRLKQICGNEITQEFMRK